MADDTETTKRSPRQRTVSPVLPHTHPAVKAARVASSNQHETKRKKRRFPGFVRQ